MRTAAVMLASTLAGGLFLGECNLGASGHPTSQIHSFAMREMERFERNGYTVAVTYTDPYKVASREAMLASGDDSFTSLPRNEQAAAVREYVEYNVVYDAEITRSDGSSAGGVALSGDPDAVGPSVGYLVTMRLPTPSGFEAGGSAEVGLRGLRFADSDRPALTDEPSIPYADVRAVLLSFIARITG